MKLDETVVGPSNKTGLVVWLSIGLVVGLGIGCYLYHFGYSLGYEKGELGGTEKAQFDFYYVKPEQKFGVYNLEDDLRGIAWTEPYSENVFDCSEMSASLERSLENMGWHTIIVIGESHSGSGNNHAWLLVETSEGKYMPVESTNIEIVWWKNPNFDKYFEYDHEFETIQDSLAYSETEFDWWKKGD